MQIDAIVHFVPLFYAFGILLFSRLYVRSTMSAVVGCEVLFCFLLTVVVPGETRSHTTIGFASEEGVADDEDEEDDATARFLFFFRLTLGVAYFCTQSRAVAYALFLFLRQA